MQASKDARMKHLFLFKAFAKFLLPGTAAVSLVIGGLPLRSFADSQAPASPLTFRLPAAPEAAPYAETSFVPAENVQPIQTEPARPFGNPAGCAPSNPNLTGEQMLASVQAAIGNEYNLAERRQLYIWNGELGSLLDVTNDAYVFEFTFNEFQHPLAYRGDQVATIFMTNGFVVWFREYGGSFRLLAIPMTAGVLESQWASYVTAYWQKDGAPNDERIYPVMKKLPCQWVVDAGYVSNEILTEMFDLDWNTPDYLSAGRRYLASTCLEANRISQEEIGYWSASSMCGPLAWTITRDANGFPYRIGSWTKDAGAFILANPRWNAQPWGTFDPETFSLVHVTDRTAGYDFQANGNLYPGDLVYTFATQYVTPGYFDHILLVAAVAPDGSRLSVSNMLPNTPGAECSIQEVTLYTPGNLETGAFNYEWNGNGFGKTGTTGFDVFRWNWITYHINGAPVQYTVRWGDTLETVAFDWKVAPESILQANLLSRDAQLVPGQVISLPDPDGSPADF